jgi:predicted nucleic acid-binding Zn ribbon protein
MARDSERSRSHPERVGGVVEALLDRLGIRSRVERAGTAAKWAESVGPHIAKVTRAARVRGGTLFVEVENASWLTELNMMRRSLLVRLNDGREQGKIDRIVFVQAGGDRQRSATGTRRRRGQSADGEGNEQGRG